MKLPSIIAAGVSVFIAVPANAQTVTASNPDTIVRALQAEGYQAKLGKDPGGDPKITSGASGSPFEIFFYGCEQNKNCQSLQFSSGYNTDDGNGPSLARLNEWNIKKRFAAASLDDENYPWLRMDVFAGPSGISVQVFKNNVDMWVNQMGEFEKHIGWGD